LSFKIRLQILNNYSISYLHSSCLVERKKKEEVEKRRDAEAAAEQQTMTQREEEIIPTEEAKDGAAEVKCSSQ